MIMLSNKFKKTQPDLEPYAREQIKVATGVFFASTSKKYIGCKNMWAAAKSYTQEKFKFFMGNIDKKDPSALSWLDQHHPFVWSRGLFGEECKVDYINNNLSESFNSWVSETKNIQIVDLHDKIRQMIIEKYVLRAKMAAKMLGTSVINALNAKSKSVKGHDVLICGPGKAEVTVNRYRYAVNLGQKTCTCRAWQVSGQPTHALAFISKISREVRMDEFVHEYLSIDRLRKAYACSFNPMASKDNWPRVDLGYKINKPKLRRKPGRPRTSRVKSFDEAATSKKRKPCPECGELGHIAKYCQGGPTASQKRNRSSSQNELSSQLSIPSASASGSSRGRGRGRGRGRASASAGHESEGVEGAGNEWRGRGRGRGRGKRKRKGKCKCKCRTWN